MSNIQKDKVLDIAIRYLKCQKKLRNCAAACEKCKCNYSEKDVKEVMEWIVKNDNSN